MWAALQTKNVFSDQPSMIQDICDGRKYRELGQFINEGNLTLTVNTDGVQLFKSSSVSMWPIWVIINELPMCVRSVLYIC